MFNSFFPPMLVTVFGVSGKSVIGLTTSQKKLEPATGSAADEHARQGSSERQHTDTVLVGICDGTDEPELSLRWTQQERVSERDRLLSQLFEGSKVGRDRGQAGYHNRGESPLGTSNEASRSWRAERQTGRRCVCSSRRVLHTCQLADAPPFHRPSMTSLAGRLGPQDPHTTTFKVCDPHLACECNLRRPMHQVVHGLSRTMPH